MDKHTYQKKLENDIALGLKQLTSCWSKGLNMFMLLSPIKTNMGEVESYVITKNTVRGKTSPMAPPKQVQS